MVKPDQDKTCCVLSKQVGRAPEDLLAEQDHEVHQDQKGIMENQELKDQKVNVNILILAYNTWQRKKRMLGSSWSRVTCFCSIMCEKP